MAADGADAVAIPAHAADESGLKDFTQNLLGPWMVWWPGTESNRRRQPFQGLE